jgi:GNAT superfamily N-acetyltransferase
MDWQMELYKRFRKTIDEFVFPLILESDRDEYIPIECDGKQVGFLLVMDERYVDGIYVEPAYRRRGLARKAVLDYVNSGKNIDSLHIVHGNETARKFWESMFYMEVDDFGPIDTLYRVKGLWK